MKIAGNDDDTADSFAAWWRRAPWSLGAEIGFAAPPIQPQSTAEQDTGYLPAGTAPDAWGTFAAQLQARFQELLGADNDDVRKFQDFMTKPENQALPTVIVRSWVSYIGNIQRVEFEGPLTPDVAASLRALLLGAYVGAPPSDLLQPIRLRLSLRANAVRTKDQ
jgi:hypothetical protein